VALLVLLDMRHDDADADDDNNDDGNDNKSARF
jgi:hypothetical protein